MLQRAENISAQLTSWRREFHVHPELNFQETRTAARVAEILAELGYHVRTGVGRTGVVADLGLGNPRIAIRADMDALPIQEQNDAPYRSQTPGVMHACGHDAHVAIALGAASLLAQETFSGSVRFLFQPSEEAADEEGISGAPRMIQDGAMQGVDMVIGLHVGAETPVGVIRLASGPISGGVDTFYATVRGKGGHGASPQHTVDPFVISAHVIQALNAITSRRLDPFHPAVISIGSLHGGSAPNVIPEQVDISGTIRFTRPEVQKQIHAEIERALGIARTLGGDYHLEFEIGTPPMVNHPAAVALIEESAAHLLGAQNILAPLDGLGAEDFGCFFELAPGAMFTLGCLIEGDRRFLHHPHFDLDERCLPVGAALLAESTLRFLAQRTPTCP